MSITTRAPYGFELEAMPIEAFGGVGKFKRSPIAASLQGTNLHGGGVGKYVAPIVGIAVAVAAPYAIPALAGAFAASTTIGTIAATAAAGAMYGAAGGALTGMISGGDVGRSVLMGGAIGGVAGGIGGYMNAPAGVAEATTLGAGSTAGGAGATSFPVSTGSSITSAPLGSTVPAGLGPTNAAAAGLNTGLGAQLSGGVSTAPGQGLGGSMTPSVNQLAASASPTGFTAPTTTAAAPTFGATTPTGLGPTNVAAASGQMATGAAGTAAPQTGFVAGLKNVGGAIADRFTDPRMLADLTLRAAGQMAGSYATGSGLSDEQQQLVNAQMAELQQLQTQNQAAFKQRLEAAQGLLGDAKYFDPEYFGLQRARQQQTAGAQAKAAGLRGTTGERRQAESRRYDLATSRNTGTAYDQGYLTGVQGNLQTQQAGLSAMPMPSQYAVNYGTTDAMLRQNEQQRLAQANQVGNLFGGLTGYSSARSTG
jgi:hypothetical protein